MRTPDRLLRADADEIEGGPPGLSPRERERYERILACSETAMGQLGSAGITFGTLAVALRISTAALRRHFSDLETLLATLISRHLRQVSRVLAEVPPDAPDRTRQSRASYLACTRTKEGDLTDAHKLLVRDRHLLPEDLLKGIETARLEVGSMLVPGDAALGLDLLDMRSLDGRQIEAALAAIGAIERRTPTEPRPTLEDIPESSVRPTIH